MKNFLLIILIFNTLNIFAQFSLEIQTETMADTIKSCDGKKIRLFALARYNSDTIRNGLNYYWYFDNGDYLSGQNEDTVEYKFLGNRAFRVLVIASNDTLWQNAVKIVQNGISPSFDGTKTDLKDGQTGICDGEKVVLTGVVNNKIYKEKRNYNRTEVFPQYIDFKHVYSSYIVENYFSADKKISQAQDIDSIGIKIEHSDIANLKISLVCPLGDTIVLKDSGGVHKYFGEPVTEAGNYDEGTGYWYWWTNTPEYGKMSQYAGTETTLPSGTYTPFDDFSALTDCPLNGKWKIIVQDYTNDADDGYVFAWSLKFSDNLYEPKIEYSNIYDLNGSFWDGDGVNVTSQGIGDATPTGEGGHQYLFIVKDNFGCYHDTSLVVNVEKPHFEIDKYSVEIGDSVHLQDRTSWATQWNWNFGDESPAGNAKEEYKKYEDKGHYTVTLTVTSASGCTDQDTASITVIPRPIEITGYNIFTPNGDGINDRFSFFNTNDEKITAANIEKITGRIYDRTGHIVCKWDTPEEAIKGWDGTIKNKGKRPAPDGFYYYILIIKGKDGKKYEPFTGVIYLYR